MIEQPLAFFICGGVIAFIGLLIYVTSERRD